MHVTQSMCPRRPSWHVDKDEWTQRWKTESEKTFQGRPEEVLRAPPTCHGAAWTFLCLWYSGKEEGRRRRRRRLKGRWKGCCKWTVYISIVSHSLKGCLNQKNQAFLATWFLLQNTNVGMNKKNLIRNIARWFVSMSFKPVNATLLFTFHRWGNYAADSESMCSLCKRHLKNTRRWQNKGFIRHTFAQKYSFHPVIDMSAEMVK